VFVVMVASVRAPAAQAGGLGQHAEARRDNPRHAKRSHRCLAKAAGPAKRRSPADRSP